MKLDKVLFLAACTPRSKAYLSAMKAAALTPGHIISFGKENEPEDVNSMEILEKVRAIDLALIIYSGYGGQIVGKELLDTGIPFLHMHAGWLPDYRGSTTIYYSLLKEDMCAVSAIILNDKIDKGVIIARKKYPPPSGGTDIDHTYDGMIRADLLVTVLKKYVNDGGFKKLVSQRGDGTEYYVIHPVLKHIAILSCGTRKEKAVLS